jgi:KH domain
MALSNAVREYAMMIGQFYLKKNDGDYIATAEEVDSLRISKIEVTDDGSVAITTALPGMLIGKRGTNVDALREHLKANIKIIEEEDPLFPYLIPQQPDEYDDWYYNRDATPPAV